MREKLQKQMPLMDPAPTTTNHPQEKDVKANKTAEVKVNIK